jgi:hypothetical protein
LNSFPCTWLGKHSTTWATSQPFSFQFVFT